ncbi:MAG: PEP-CTERM sorting domain-containing protein [Verrucomicrobiota bacterium]
MLANSAPNNWSSGTPIATTTYSFDLSSVSALNNAPAIYFRLVDASTTAANGTTVAASGTGRVDNFTVTATLVPEPGALALVSGFGWLMLFFKRRRP